MSHWQGYHGHPRFYTLLEEIADLHARKNADYSGTDPLSNLRMCEAFGVPASLGVLVRMSDKWSRVVNLVRKGMQGEVKDEGLADTLRDLSVYSLLAIILLEEASPCTKSRPEVE